MSRQGRRIASPRVAVLAACALALGLAPFAHAHFGPVPISLKGVPVPEVPGLLDGPDPIVVDEEKAIALGKALFWDVNVGSDGVACATCHFHAGADRRTRNQLAPFGKPPVPPAPTWGPAAAGGDRGPNYTLVADDFPLHETDDPLSPLGNVIRSSDDVVSSAGTFGGAFESVSREASTDACDRMPDAVHHVGALGTRRVEPRNAPSVINAVFNHRNLWDGSANNVFNGSSPYGDRDPDAGVFVMTGPGTVEKQRLRLENSSLASQALGPPGNDVEMSCGGRRLADVARKLACRRPLERQNVHWNDSVLAPYARSTEGQLRKGLDVSYQQLVSEAFAPRFWAYEGPGDFGAPPGEGAAPYDQYEANFGMFFALALQLYQSTLVSDDSPFDRSAVDEAGVPTDLTPSELNGFTEFRIAHCALCHIGPLLTSAAVDTNAQLVHDNPLAFGNQTFSVSTTFNVVTRTSTLAGPAVIDTGFASTGVTPELDDLGVGGFDPFGNPLSFAEQYLRFIAGDGDAVVDDRVDEVRACDFEVPLARDEAEFHEAYFTQVEGVVAQPQSTEGCFVPDAGFLPTPSAAAAELASPTNTKMRSSAAGSFKIPGLRNIELTGPYMHNGSMATLEEVVEFYTRGGNFGPDALHFATVFPQVALRFSETKRNDIIAFLKTLTDDRVRYERAPFDHPELPVAHGHPGDHQTAQPGGPAAGLAADVYFMVAAVGAEGRAEPLEGFDAYLASCTDECAPVLAADELPVADGDPFDYGDYCERVVPESGAWALQAFAFAALGALRRRR